MKIVSTKERVERGNIYRHFKGGKYGVTKVDMKNGEMNVWYKDLATGEEFNRPLEEFVGFSLDGYKRFTLIDTVAI